MPLISYGPQRPCLHFCFYLPYLVVGKSRPNLLCTTEFKIPTTISFVLRTISSSNLCGKKCISATRQQQNNSTIVSSSGSDIYNTSCKRKKEEREREGGGGGGGAGAEEREKDKEKNKRRRMRKGKAD